MYPESSTGLMFSQFQNFSQEIHHLPREFCKTQNPNAFMSNQVQTFNIYDYDMGSEWDLFKAPELIIEEADLGLDPMTAAISMISCGEDAISSQGLEVSDFESLQADQFLSEVFYEKDLYYECESVLLEKEAIETPAAEIPDIKSLVSMIEENQIPEDKPLVDVSFQKSVSFGCLDTGDWMQGAAMKPSNFLGFPGMDMSAVYGMRRAFSEGDIKTLSNHEMGLIPSLLKCPLLVPNPTSEERREKLSRYRNKKTRRNFGRKIKYACRKALADSQPRIRGRFAKTEELDSGRQ